MKKKKPKLYATTVTLALAAGVTAGVTSYRSGTQFQPSASSREIKENQVTFSGDEKRKEQSQDESQDNSALWEKDEQAQERSRMDAARDAAYLFEQAQNQLNNGNGHTNINLAQQNENQTPDVSGQKNQSDQNEKDPVYDITDKKENADTVIRDNGNGTADNKNPSQNSGGNVMPKPDNGDTTGTGGSTSEDSNSASGSDDKDQSTSGNDKSDSSGDNSGKTDKDDSKDNTNQPSKPSSPSSTAKDPVINKKPNANIGPGESQKDYNESDVTTKVTNREIRIYQGSDEAALYKGQSVDSVLLFYALDTYVYDSDTYTAYTWNQNDYGHYIRIAGVSFDGGENWITQFPVTIPETLEDGSMYIKVEWRYSDNERWEEYITPYFPYSTRLFLLPQKLEKENEEIDAETLLNQWDQFPNVGTLKLYRYTGNFFQNMESPLTALLPGWTENGEVIPWSYNLTAGRHILEPQELVPLDPMYIAEIQFGWFGSDDRIATDIMDPDTALYYLQTLTGLNVEERGEDNRKYIKELNVPKYIQSVSLTDQIETDVMSIADTVLYVENNGNSLRVNHAFQVEEMNPNYASENGLLMDKEKTKIIGIPYEKDCLTVEKNIIKVNLTQDNHLRSVEIKADNMENFPEIPLENLSDCKIIVEDQIFNVFMELYGEELTEQHCCVARSSDRDRTFTMNHGMVLDEAGSLYRVLGYTGTSLRLSSGITAIEENAFCEAGQLHTLIWPKNAQIELNTGSFAESNVEKIVCQSREQMVMLRNELDELGIKNILILISEKSDEGYSYYSEGADDHKITTTVTEAPADVKEFNGVINVDGKEVTVNEIAANAFSNCNQLEWVILPEESCYIGYQAFRNCGNLQGILINARDTITIGDQAFQGCNGLRFIASNAKKGVMEDGYDPDVTNQEYYEPNRKFHYFFVPSDAEGYGSNANKLTEAYGVDHYEICQTGKNGKVLYGLDENASCWLALRSSSNLDEETKLPAETTQIYSYAFSGSQKTGNGYRLNWDELSIMEVQEGAFYESGLSGDVIFGSEEEPGFVTLRQNAFMLCEKINSVAVKDRLLYLGQEMFVGDSSLKTVEFTGAEANVSFYTGMFNGCNQLRTLKLGMITPLQLVAYASMKYQFNYDWTPEEEAEHLQLLIPEESKMEYLMNWRYQFAGSFGLFFSSSYLDLRQNVWDNLIFEFYPDDPPEEFVDQQTKQSLLEAENRLRKMTGLQEVSEPTDLYQYRQVGINLTLVGVPSYVTDVTLDDITLDFLEGWYLDAIGAGAFSGASDLKQVTIYDDLSEIASGALSGAATNSDSVTINIVKAEANNTIATLSGYTEGTPFTFGIEDSKLHIQVPDGEKKDYIRSWTYPLTGYTDEASMEAAVRKKLEKKEENGNDDSIDSATDTEQNPDEKDVQQLLDQKVQEEMCRLLLPAENRLRRMMGMETIEDPEDLICYDYVPYDDAKEATETEESEDTTEEQSESETSDQESEAADASEAESEEQTETKAEETEGQSETGEEKETTETTESSASTETEADADEEIRQATEFTVCLPETQKEREE